VPADLRAAGGFAGIFDSEIPLFNDAQASVIAGQGNPLALNLYTVIKGIRQTLNFPPDETVVVLQGGTFRANNLFHQPDGFGS